MSHVKLKKILSSLSEIKDSEMENVFPYYYALSQKLDFNFVRDSSGIVDNQTAMLALPDMQIYMRAYCMGILSKDFLYKAMFEIADLSEALEDLSYIVKFAKEREQKPAERGRDSYYREERAKYVVEKLLGWDDRDGKETEAVTELNDEETRRLAVAGEIYEKITAMILDMELGRGDSETDFSKQIYSIRRIYGLEYFVRILSALGTETLERSGWFNYSYRAREGVSKRRSLSHLLQVCMPEPNDDAQKLEKLLAETDIGEHRLIEAAFYSPEWMDIIGEYLGFDGFISGCYYFIAHMNEEFDDKRTAVIAKYTHIPVEELQTGAFDINWFCEVYETLGKTETPNGNAFDLIYESAKYISSGAKHTRARKYADAVTGKMDAEETVIAIQDKRNKDLLMAYGLIPYQAEGELTRRYLVMQQFLKESRQFGAQRRASEAVAVKNAIRNLALNAGYPDETRFILRMEAEITSGLLSYFQPEKVGDAEVYLSVSEEGKVSVQCEKAGKALKSVPAKLKKEEYIVSLNEAKKTLNEQFSRTKKMLEEAMEEETEFEFGELVSMMRNPVTSSIVEKLVIKADDKIGLLSEDGSGIRDYAGTHTKRKTKDKVVIAHPYHLFRDGHWHDYQKLLFDKGIRQPFKQVFRELYVKTEEETELTHSLRYAGNQIQPKRTVGCLKSRRWVADAECGLQKVYYRENLIAQIYALADWFSPADIEAPTLEWVVFTDRKTFKEVQIKEVPDILFSEVMRDVDMAVSVAHVGGVDPEASHSTVEMRRAIAEFTLPLFQLENVTFTEKHAVIKGTKADYTVHLGSGVVHQMGGPMINVLPVHSQHRGRIFLPFVDDDPKTAEILSKIILFAEDGKIKDPFILDQIAAL